MNKLKLIKQEQGYSYDKITKPKNTETISREEVINIFIEKLKETRI